MTALVSPDDAVAAVRVRIRQRWADAVCAELGIGDGVVFSVPLCPGVSSGKDVERLGYAAWHEWHMRWRELSGRLPAGVEVVRRAVTIRGVPGEFPATLKADLDGAEAAAVFASARQRVFEALDGIERGVFPPKPYDPVICGWCAFTAVCRKDYVGDE